MLQQDQDEMLNEGAYHSRLAKLLDLSVNHNDGFVLNPDDKNYLAGWQHCLLAITGKVN